MEDHSNFTVGLALKAAAMGLPYLPTYTGLGGDIVRGHPRIPCRFGFPRIKRTSPPLSEPLNFP